jgi:hypothetical protein
MSSGRVERAYTVIGDLLEVFCFTPKNKFRKNSSLVPREFCPFRECRGCLCFIFNADEHKSIGGVKWLKKIVLGLQ